MKKFIKLILTIGVTFAYIFGAAAFMENYYMFLYGRNAVFYTSNNFFAVQILAFLIFLAAMAYFWSRDGLESLDCGSDKGIKSRKKTDQKVILTGIAVIILLTVNLIFAHCYHRITPDGVEMHCLFLRKNYTWDDVDYYTLNTHIMDDTLSMKVVMKDGRKVELLPSVLSTESDGFDMNFKDDVYDFLPWLNEKFIEKNKPLKLKDEKDLLQRLKKYEVWAELAEDIIEACQRSDDYPVFEE